MNLVLLCHVWVTLIGLQIVSGTPKRRSGEYDVVTVPDECKDQNYCTIKPPDYPQEVFNEMFKDYKPIPVPVVDEEVDLGNRRSEPGDSDGCTTKVMYEPLYQVRSKEGDWRTVIQAPEKNYIQRVRLELCKNTNKPCFGISKEDYGVETVCRQQFIVWKVLVAVKNGSETINTDLPVCCSCKYRDIPPYGDLINS